MPEPTNERRKPKGPIEIIHQLERSDTNIVELRQCREQLLRRFVQNRTAISNGDWAAVEPYQVPEYIPIHPMEYPVEVSRRGEFISRQPERFSHLPQRADVPGVVRLSLGDLDAGAEWDLFPVMESTDRHRPAANAARDRIEDVRYQAMLRRLYTARGIYGTQVWQAVFTNKDKSKLSWTNFRETLNDTDIQTQRLTATDVEKLLMEDNVLAERMVFTLAARLGGRATPPFRAFQARAGVDTHEHVDVILRVEPPQQDPTLVGLDVTMRVDEESLWNKYYRQRGQGRSAVSGTMRDPATLDRHLSVFREILSIPAGIDWKTLMQRWQQRQQTMVTPEYLIQSALRERLANRILQQIKAPNGTKYCSDQTSKKLYQQLYS